MTRLLVSVPLRCAATHGWMVKVSVQLRNLYTVEEAATGQFLERNLQKQERVQPFRGHVGQLRETFQASKATILAKEQ